MKVRLIIISMILFSPLIVGCGPKHPGPAMTKEGVDFSFSAPQARSVAIAGSFNAWNIHRDALSGPDKNGVWNITLPLREGRYEYLFVIDGKDWQRDPSVPEVEDGFGGKNSVLVVPGEHSGL